VKPLFLMAVFAAMPLAAQQQPARTTTPPRAQTPAPRPGAAAPAQRPAARPGQHPPRDTTLDSTVVVINYNREVYNYQGGSRDPFGSLLTDASTQTSINDLRLVSILYDRGGRSVAIVREKNTTSPRRLRRGDSIGRLRVIQIREYEVVFQLEEFGFERQEVLTLQRPGVSP
jgi:hypothetical protein